MGRERAGLPGRGCERDVKGQGMAGGSDRHTKDLNLLAEGSHGRFLRREEGTWS